MYGYLMVFVGGGMGSLLRYGLTKIMTQHSLNFPTATFVANILSCIVLGALIGYQMKNGITDLNRLLLMTGFCGGFSTFSTFSAESFQLFNSGQIGMGLIYIGTSIILCLISIWLGIKLV